MKNINLKLVALITDFKYEEDKKVYDSDYLARTIKCNGGGYYLIHKGRDYGRKR